MCICFYSNQIEVNLTECCTCRHHCLYSCAVDEGPLDGLSPNIRPIDTLLQSVIIHNRDVVDVRDGEGDDVVVVWIIDVHSSYLNLTGVQQELTWLWKRDRDKRPDWGQKGDKPNQTKGHWEKKNKILQANEFKCEDPFKLKLGFFY